MEKVVGLLVGLGQETRLRILEQLADGGTLTPNELAEPLGLTQQNVSKHLKTLAQAGIVARTRDGSSALYRIKDASILAIIDDVVTLVVRDVREIADRPANDSNPSATRSQPTPSRKTPPRFFRSCSVRRQTVCSPTGPQPASAPTPRPTGRSTTPHSSRCSRSFAGNQTITSPPI